MEIKQNHYSTDFENDAVRVSGDELSDGLSSDSDVENEAEPVEIEGHCKKVSKRRSAYESNIATEKGLIELGKHMAARENAKQKRATKYLYLVTSVKELDGFHGAQFLSEVSNCKDKNLLMGKIQSLVGYVSMFKELYNHHVEDISDLNKEIESLKVENTDMGEMIDKYIEAVDAEEAKVAKVSEEVTKCKKVLGQREKKLADYYGLMAEHEKTIGQLTSDNQIYAANKKVYQNDKTDWANQKTALDIIVLKQQKTIALLNKENACVRALTRQCLMFSIGLGVVVIGSAAYSWIFGKFPLEHLFSDGVKNTMYSFAPQP